MVILMLVYKELKQILVIQYAEAISCVLISHLRRNPVGYHGTHPQPQLVACKATIVAIIG